MKLVIINILLGGIVATGVLPKDARDGITTGASNFQKALEFTLPWEGGYVNHPSDPGGATNFGVTQNTYDAYRNRVGKPVQPVRQISKEEKEEIYKSYWLDGGCDKYATPLDIACLDSVINFGVAGGKSFFNDLPSDPTEAAVEVAKRRMEYRNQRVRQAPSQQVFLNGWLNRDKALEDYVKQESNTK